MKFNSYSMQDFILPVINFLILSMRNDLLQK